MSEPEGGVQGEGWLAFHVHYHEDRDRLLCGWLDPLAGSLVQGGLIDRFFFVRYSRGGPHVRLRLRPLPGRAAAVAAQVSRTAAEFLAAHPSARPLDEDRLRRDHEAARTGGPDEADETIYPDNLVRPAPFHPEVERYGGPAHLGASLTYFCLTSAAALAYLRAERGAPWSERLAFAFRLFARQILGFAGSAGEALELAGVLVASWGEPMAPIAVRGDQLFAQRETALVKALGREIEALGQDGPLADAELALGLRREVDELAAPVRRRIFQSQIHLNANRLGLPVHDEVYVARLVERTFAAIASDASGIHQQLERRLARHRGAAGERLADLLPRVYRSRLRPPAGLPAPALSGTEK